MSGYERFSPAIPDTSASGGSKRQRGYSFSDSDNLNSIQDSNPRQRKKNNRGKEVKNKRENIFVRTGRALTSTTSRWIFGLLMTFLAVYLGIAFFSYFTTCIVDQSEINNTAIGTSADVANAAGEGGARIAEYLINEFFGVGSFVIIFWLVAMGLKMLLGRPKFKPVNFTIKCIIALITLSMIVGLFTIGMQSNVNWGGYHGKYVNEFVVHFLGWSGAVLLCIFLFCCFVLICLRDVVKWVLKLKAKYDEARRIREQERLEKEARERELEAMRNSENSGQGVVTEPTDDDTNNEETADSDQRMNFSEENTYSELPGLEETEFASYNAEFTSYNIEDKEEHNIEDKEEQQNPEDGAEEKQDADNDVLSENEKAPGSDEGSDVNENEQATEPLEMVVNVNSISQTKDKKPTHQDAGPGSFPYNFPPYDILRPGETKISVDAEEQNENKEKIRRTLNDFDIQITNIEATIGPTVTLYEIVPDKGIRVAKIKGLVDDIALSLSAEGVRIIAPIPGKGTVGIEVANKDPQTVSMQTILRSPKFQNTKYKLPVAIGSTISNDVYIVDLAKMPHLLVAGATGQGKSVGLNAIIASLLYSKRPDELKFVMIDPKMVEFSLYAKIEGHYLAKIPGAEDAIITDMDKVIATLSSLCIEMDNRYQLLKDAEVRNIIEYNEKIKEGKLNPNDGHRYLPYIVVVVDEFSDLIMTAGKEVEVPIARLAQKARAVGMHVIIATQRPSTNVITGIIKANFPARIAFKVASMVDSKTILDTTGAQQLIGRGDMLVSNSAPMVRVQCAFIDTPEVEKICEYISRQPYAQGAYILPEPIVKGDSEGGGGEAALGSERDPLFEEVARLVVTSNNASTSSLQRRYSIGYNRAGKIMDQLEAAGIVGPAQGGKPRAVLMDPVSLDLLLSN